MSHLIDVILADGGYSLLGRVQDGLDILQLVFHLGLVHRHDRCLANTLNIVTLNGMIYD